MRHNFLRLLSAILFVIASLVSSTACLWLFHQSKTPKCLLKK
ncbi:MAG: cyclic lactone autoinducer peptide [Bacillota bacterium]|nr:cyclic lactone autoinducer peptide [Bacillota bacterium]